MADAAPVLAICLAIAFLPLRGEQDAYRAALPPVRPRTVAICAVAVAFIASSVSSAIAYRSELHPQNSRSYLATASAALADVPPDAVIYPTQVPAQMASSLFGQLSQVQNALAPLADQVPGQRFRWTSSPTGLVKHFMIFDAQGRLHPATVQGRARSRSATKATACSPPSGMRLPLTANVFPLPLLMQIGYYAARPVTLAVTFGGHQYQVTLARQHAGLRLPAGAGPRQHASIITPVTPDPKICIGTVTIGNVQASATGTPVPAFPLPG